MLNITGWNILKRKQGGAAVSIATVANMSLFHDLK
jgi:hypothetical protein